MISKVLRVVILGPPGSGKGTISERIVRDFGLTHASSGNLLRSQVLNGTKVGLDAKQYMDKGQLLPDLLMVSIICAELAKLTGSWLLDGFPRTVNQATLLQEKYPIDIAINLDVPIKVIVERIKGRWTHLPSGRVYNTEFNPPKKKGIDDITGEPLVQRDDDKPEVVTKRLETYAENTQGILDYYRGLHVLTEFHGTESNKIWPHVQKFLCQRIQPKSGL